jgi:hypothetical protein
MHMSLAHLLVALSSIILSSTVLFLMMARRLRAKFPLFFALVTLYAISLPVLFATYEFSYNQYFYAYWTISTLVMLLGFAVMYEVFVAMLKPYSAVIDLAKTLFCWAGLFLFAAGFLTALVTSGPSVSKMVVAIDLCDRCVHMMQCGMLLLIFLLERRLSFSWRSSAMSIALGLGVWAAADLIVSYGQARFPSATLQWDMVYGVSFVSVMAFWAFALRSAESARNTVSDPPTRLILQRWNEALIGYGYGESALATSSFDSFLPGVEQTVEKIMARKMVQ